MKFLLVVHYFEPHIGGMEVLVDKQAQSLTKLGHEVTVVTCRPDNRSPIRETTEHGYRIVRLRALNFIEAKFGVTFPVIAPTELLRLLKMMPRYDVIHIHDVFYMSSHLAGIAAALRRKPLYLTQHVAMVDHPSRAVTLIQKIVYHTFGMWLFKRAHKIVVYNINVRNFLTALGVQADKVLQNYNGIDTQFFVPVRVKDKQAIRRQYDLPLSKPLVLFVGRFVPKKGFSIVIKARAKQYNLLLAGGLPPDGQTSRDGMILFGTASQATLRDLYQAADLFVFPAIGEIFTIVMQEAMACGLPVVTTDDPAYHVYGLDPDKFTLVPRNVASVKAALVSLTKDKRQLQTMARYSRQIAEERFSWDKNYAKEYAIYGQSQA